MSNMYIEKVQYSFSTYCQLPALNKLEEEEFKNHKKSAESVGVKISFN